MPPRRPHWSPRPPWDEVGWYAKRGPEAVENEFGPPAVQCESQAPPELFEEDELARSVADLAIFWWTNC